MKRKQIIFHGPLARQRIGFSLVELLVVIAIISLLGGMLLPTLHQARESSKRLQCLSNLRQLDFGLIMYCGDNGGYLPRPAPNNFNNAQPEDAGDWIYWQQATTSQPRRQIADSPIAKYVGNSFSQISRCPSDENWSARPGNPVDTGPNNWGDGPYAYSYVLNGAMTSYPGNYGRPVNIKPAIHLSSVRLSSTKILLYEEDEVTINDGNGKPFWGGTAAAPGQPNLLAIRHDVSVKIKEKWDGKWGDIPNANARGNAAFCDGHAEYVVRAMIHDLTNRFTDPAFPN